MKNAAALRKASAKSSKALSKTDIGKIIGMGAKPKKESVAPPQEETSPLVKTFTELTTTVIPGIVSEYSSIENPNGA